MVVDDRAETVESRSDHARHWAEAQVIAEWFLMIHGGPTGRREHHLLAQAKNELAGSCHGIGRGRG